MTEKDTKNHLVEEEISEDKKQQILEKFDAESKVRKFVNKKTIIFVSILAILYSLFHLYITFNPMPTLQQRDRKSVV